MNVVKDRIQGLREMAVQEADQALQALLDQTLEVLKAHDEIQNAISGESESKRLVESEELEILFTEYAKGDESRINGKDVKIRETQKDYILKENVHYSEAVSQLQDAQENVLKAKTNFAKQELLLSACRARLRTALQKAAVFTATDAGIGNEHEQTSF